MITKELIIEAYLFLRKHNQTIPEETLEFMKYSSLKAFKNSFNNEDSVGSLCKCGSKHEFTDMDTLIKYCSVCGGRK